MINRPIQTYNIVNFKLSIGFTRGQMHDILTIYRYATACYEVPIKISAGAIHQT